MLKGRGAMREETFVIEYPKSKAERSRWNKQYGMNAIYAGKHWSKRKEDSEFWHSMVRAAISRANIPKKMFDKPVSIEMYWNDNLDVDNHAYEGKMIVDAMKGWLIQDDSRKYVKSVLHRFHDDGDYILVKISDKQMKGSAKTCIKSANTADCQ